MKELYINGRLWYDQPAPRVADTMSLFATSTELEKLVLSRPVQTYIPLNDVALKGLAPLTSLTWLQLGNTPVTDAGLKELGPLTNLTTLDLGNTPVTDAGLKELAAVKSLSVVYLFNTKVTDAGARALQKALPKCKVVK